MARNGHNGNGKRQEERSAAMRERLLSATFECLVEKGYAGTSTPEVLKRAGVSRGAMLHHFPTKADLVAATVDFLLQRQLEEFEAAFEDLPDDADRASSAIELMWGSLSGPSHYAWLELVMASRTDPVLREKVQEVIVRFEDGLRTVYKRIFPRAAGGAEPIYKYATPFSFAVLTGLAVANIYQDEQLTRKGVDSLKQLATFVDELYRGRDEDDSRDAGDRRGDVADDDGVGMHPGGRDSEPGG